MNARTVKKRLMKNRLQVFWGRRAFVTVRLPKSLFPAPPPDYPTPASLYPGRALTAEEGGWEPTFEGHWYRDVLVRTLPEEERADFDPEDQDQWAREAWSISKLSGADPRLAYPDGDHGIEDRHIILRDTWTDAKGVTHDTFEWWEGVYRCQITPDKDTLLSRGEGQEFVIDPEIIDQYIARREWVDTYIVGYKGDTGNEVIDAFLSAANYAKTTYHRMTDKYVYLTYSVKWFYPRYKLQFCTDLKHAFDVARKNGVQVKLMKGVF